MKLFVTGAAGFIGSNYVRHVLETSDDQVVIYSLPDLGPGTPVPRPLGLRITATWTAIRAP